MNARGRGVFAVVWRGLFFFSFGGLLLVFFLVLAWEFLFGRAGQPDEVFFFFFSFFLPCLFIPGTYQIRSYRVTVFVNDSMVIKTGANSNLSYLTHDQGLGVEFWCRRTVRAHVFHWFREGGGVRVHAGLWIRTCDHQAIPAQRPPRPKSTTHVLLEARGPGLASEWACLTQVGVFVG